MIKLDLTKLLGFKITVDTVDGAKAGAKRLPTIGAKAGNKPARV